MDMYLKENTFLLTLKNVIKCSSSTWDLLDIRRSCDQEEEWTTKSKMWGRESNYDTYVIEIFCYLDYQCIAGVIYFSTKWNPTRLWDDRNRYHPYIGRRCKCVMIPHPTLLLLISLGLCLRRANIAGSSTRATAIRQPISWLLYPLHFTLLQGQLLPPYSKWIGPLQHVRF